MDDWTLESKANDLGIPMQIEIDDSTRYPECNAHAATLTSIEGKRAIYQGQCAMGHTYEMDYLIEELQAMTHIENGELVFGEEKGYKAEGLEEF